MTNGGYLEHYRAFDPPIGTFDPEQLGGEFTEELATVSRLWLSCGYRPGIVAYLNFFLHREFIEIHDAAFPARFRSFRSMADSFYRTDLFVRAVTDSGRSPTGGISSPAVRSELDSIMQRHRRLSIPGWMMSYFGYSLVELVEKECPAADPAARQRHLSYFSKTFRIMGVAFSDRRELMESFSREVEAAHVAPSPHLETHARHILVLAEMAGVSSGRESLGQLLPDRSRALFDTIYPRVRPGAVRKHGARLLGRFLMKQAIGKHRAAEAVDRAG